MSETILIGVTVALVLMLLGRELACWYWKINKPTNHGYPLDTQDHYPLG